MNMLKLMTLNPLAEQATTVIAESYEDENNEEKFILITEALHVGFLFVCGMFP